MLNFDCPWIPFNADEINLIYQFGEQGKAETCAHLSAILPQIKDSDTKQIVSTTLKKLNALSEETCAELTATTNATNEQLGIAVHWEHRSFKEQGIDREPTA